jgi:hypothetical protein
LLDPTDSNGRYIVQEETTIQALPRPTNNFGTSVKVPGLTVGDSDFAFVDYVAVQIFLYQHGLWKRRNKELLHLPGSWLVPLVL